MKKRFLSCLMALAMCLTLLPTAALAEDTQEAAQPAMEGQDVPAEEQAETPAPEEEPEQPETASEPAPQAAESGIAVQAGEVHTDHCICGKTHKKIGDHKTEKTHAFDQWLGISQTSGTLQLLVGGTGHSIYGDNVPTSDASDDWYLTGGSYYLKTDESSFLLGTVTIDHAIEIRGDVTICLNGQTIQRSNGGPVFKIVSNGTLTLTDCSDNMGKVRHPNDVTGIGVEVSRGGKFNLYGGTIIGNGTDRGGVYVNGGTFNMYGGKITENRATSNGGGVSVAYNGTFTMYGGEITKNEATGSGGGVSVADSGKFTMSGDAKITDNIAKGNGGGVYVYSGTFTMNNDASIADNKVNNVSGSSGGGVYFSGTKFEMNDNACVTGNEATNSSYPLNGGGVYVTSGGSFTMNGSARVTGNKASGSSSGNNDGGGVYVNIGSKFIMNGEATSVSGNTATGSGGGVFVAGSLEMNGNASVSGNTAIGNGGGVHMGTSGSTFAMNGNASVKDNEVTGNSSSGGGVYAGGTFTVSGNPTVTGNKDKGNDANNVYLGDGKRINIGGDLNGSKESIGVTTADTPEDNSVTIADSVTTDYSGKFFSDNSQYEVEYENGKLVLKTDTPPVTPTEHTHCVCGTTHKEIGDHTVESIPVNGWTGISSLTEIKDAGYYYLTQNVELTSSWSPVSGVVLCLNGKTITGPSAEKGNEGYVNEGYVNEGYVNEGYVNEGYVNEGYVIAVKDGTDFTLTDCNDVQGKITHAEGTEGSGVYVENGALKLYGGSITGNNGEISSYLGSGVYVGNGKFNMYGGSITGNKGGSYCLGGGVYVTESSEFHMYGGAVSDNNAGFGGGVEASGTFRMCGGSITGNTATYGGGVYVREGGTFTVSGNVTVTGNTAIEKTNNVYLSKATLIGVIDALTGGASIGVTTAEPPTKDSPVTIVANPNSSDISELIKRITSDNTAYEIAEKDNTIVLKAKDDSTPTKKGEQAPLTLSASKTTLTVGETLPLTVTGGSTNGTVTYQVSDTSVANINNHILTANKVGTVEVTATMSGDETYSDVTSNSITITITEKSVDPTPTPTPNPGTGGNTGSNGGNSSSSSSDRDRDPSYAVSTPAKTEHGTVTVSPKSASQGDRVTLTVTPDSGYVLDELTVTDSKGNELKLTNQGGGKYTFSMPNGKVEVKAGFVLQSAAQPFGDVASDAYYAEAVKWAVENGITNGKANGLFGSNDPCTRGQIVTFLWRAAGSPASKGTAAVPADVIPGSYCYDAIAWAIENGITNGLEDGSFGAGGACTRAQCVALLFRSAVANGLEAVTLQDLISGFGDAAELPAYAVPAMNWALSGGIVQGNGGLLLSNVACTRAQIVTFLWRLYTGK